MPNSRFALHGLAPPSSRFVRLFLPLIHGLCTFLRPLLTPVSTALFLPASQFTVCTSRLRASRKDQSRSGSQTLLKVWIAFRY